MADDRIELPGGWCFEFRYADLWTITAPDGGAWGLWTEDKARAFAEALRATPAVDGVPADRYRHKKRGKTYEVVGEACLQLARVQPFEGSTLVIYRSEEDGKLWARHSDEFHDGRFERIAAQEAQHAAPEAQRPAMSERWHTMYQGAVSALAMVREAVESIGPVASLESAEAVLLRGPEPVHEAEAIVDAIIRVKAHLAPEPPASPAEAPRMGSGVDAVEVERVAKALEAERDAICGLGQDEQHQLDADGEIGRRLARAAIAALATRPATPPQEAEAEPNDGWLYHNPDTGEEWAEDHPIESGEVVDAERVRPATLANLKEELFAAWRQISKPASEPPAAASVEGEAEKRGVIQGMILACTTAVRSHSREEVAEGILREAGITEDMVRVSGLSDFDIDTVAPIAARIERGAEDEQSPEPPTQPIPAQDDAAGSRQGGDAGGKL